MQRWEKHGIKSLTEISGAGQRGELPALPPEESGAAGPAPLLYMLGSLATPLMERGSPQKPHVTVVAQGTAQDAGQNLKVGSPTTPTRKSRC